MTTQNIKYARIKYKNEPYFCEYENNIYHILDKSYFENAKRTGQTVENPELLTPVCEKSTKIVAIGKNYKAHAIEMGLDIPTEPLMFLKPQTALLPPEKNIIYPKISKQVDYEAELAIIISKTSKNVKKEDAFSHIFGYTCANDVTARDLQKIDGQWTRAKSFDTFLPLGPMIVKNIDTKNLNIKSILNGEIKQNSNTSEFIFDIPTLISAITSVMTLYSGDVILTGTPKGIGPMQIGDEIKIEIENIGTLVNKVL